MPGLITHITLTNKIFDKYFKDKEKNKFFIGTSFPDIRYLNVIERKRTHFRKVDFDDIRSENSFFSGLKFHSLVDQIREEFIESKDIYLFYPKSKYITQSMKLLEDEVLYNNSKNWQEIIDFFDKILPEEISFGIKENDIRRWHKILQKYYSQQPNNDSINKFAVDLGFPADIIKESKINIKQMKSNKKIIQIIEDFYNNFEIILKNYL